MEYISIKNWERYQHFTDGRPVKWVKVYTDLLEKYDREGKENAWRGLSDKAVRLCIALWLLRAKFKNIPNDSAWIEAQTGVAPKFAINELVLAGFVSLGAKETETDQSRNESGTNPVRDCDESGALDLRDRDRERDREREEEKENRNGSCTEAAPSVAARLQTLVDDWNEIAEANGISKVLHIGARSKAAKERLSVAWWRDNYRAALEAIPASDFLMGRCEGKSWRADFEFFIRPDSVAKILEGKYANNAAKKKTQEGAEPEKPSLEKRIAAYRKKHPEDPEDYMLNQIADPWEIVEYREKQQRKHAAVSSCRSASGVTKLGDVLNEMQVLS